MKRSIVFANPEFSGSIEIAQRAEERGFHRVWTTETPSRDALIRALTIALRTRTIQVASGIAYAFTRAPLGLAATAADIQLAAGGRFSLGLGAGTRGMRRHWYGIEDFDHPAPRLAEYARLLRTAWRSEREFHHSGRFYRGAYDQLDGARRPVPLWGSGLNPVMLATAARHFDGIAVHPLAGHPTYFDRVVAPARGSHEVPIAVWRMVAVDRDPRVARERARRSLAFYFTTPSYGTVAEVTGWAEVAATIRSTYASTGPDWSALGQLVPGPMLDEFCLAGSADEVRDRWRHEEESYAARGVDEVVFQTAGSIGGSGDDGLTNLTRIVDCLAPRLPYQPFGC